MNPGWGNGTGMITGQALQGRDQDQQLWTDLLAPVNSLGATKVRSGNKGGTDHLSFIPYGVPGWNFDQETRGYNHTHHSQVDTYDHAVPGDLKQASAVMAVTALELANLPVLLPRGEKREVRPPQQMMAGPSFGSMPSRKCKRMRATNGCGTGISDVPTSSAARSPSFIAWVLAPAWQSKPVSAYSSFD